MLFLFLIFSEIFFKIYISVFTSEHNFKTFFFLSSKVKAITFVLCSSAESGIQAAASTCVSAAAWRGVAARRLRDEDEGEGVSVVLAALALLAFALGLRVWSAWPGRPLRGS